MVEQLRHDDVRSLDEADAGRGGGLDRGSQQAAGPRPRGIDERPRAQLLGGAGAAILDGQAPGAGVANRRDAARARADLGAAHGRGQGIEHDQARVLHPAVGVFESQRVTGFQRRAGGIMAKPHATRVPASSERPPRWS